jgi:signal transduction histidine kinase
MEIDVRTLFLVHSAVSLALGALMIIFWWAHRSMPGLGLWTFGTAVIGFTILGGALRGVIPDFLSIVVANGLVFASMAAYWNGIRLFRGRRARWAGALAVIAAASAFLAHRTYVENDFLDRIVVASALVSLGCFLCARELLRRPRDLRGTAFPAAVLFAAVGATLAVRAFSMALWAPEPDLFAPTLPQSVHLIVSLLSNILIVVALLMMAAQRLQRQLETRNGELEAAQAGAEQASRAKSEFLAMMSHELRTPLNAVLGFSDMLREEVFGPLGHPRYREYASDIHSSGTHLLELINTILDISKAEAGKLEIRACPLDPRLILDEAVRLVAGAAETKLISISLDLPEEPCRCFADPQALRQILVNLLSNAVKFTPAGGAVTVHLRPAGDGGVEFVVRDTGVGIAEADIPRLMRPFERAVQTYALRSEGTGLGLPMVETLVRLHGGSLRIESAVGVGTAITVRLPPPSP